MIENAIKLFQKHNKDYQIDSIYESNLLPQKTVGILAHHKDFYVWKKLFICFPDGQISGVEGPIANAYLISKKTRKVK